MRPTPVGREPEIKASMRSFAGWDKLPMTLAMLYKPVVAVRTQIAMGQWRKSVQAAAVAALGLSAAWVFAYGRVSDPSDALMRLVLGYPLCLVILRISIAPGMYLAKRLALNPWWALPTTSILMLVAIGR